jgi:hypothetical protein
MQATTEVKTSRHAGAGRLQRSSQTSCMRLQLKAEWCGPGCARAAALEAVRRKREDRYDRFVRPLDRRRDELAAEVAARVKALSGGQYAEAQRVLTAITKATSA